MAHLSVRVLGGLRVSIEDEILSSFESDRVRALFAYLVVESGRAHRRETLAGLFWPDYSEEAAHHNLSQALFNLRKAIGDHTASPPYLQISRDAIQFNRESDCSLDLARLNACFFAWEGSRGQDLARVEEMAELYQGEFLQGFSLKDSAGFEEWLLVQRASVHQRFMPALAALAEDYEKRGEFHSARRCCSRQLELDPWREEAHCHLMRLLALEGERSAALAQYELCKKVLADELGVEPSSTTRDLYERIRLGKIRPWGEPAPGEPSAGIPAAGIPAAGIPTSPPLELDLPQTPFLGRKKELAELGQMIANPQCRCISLVGPGGIGKTRLALEAAGANKHAFTHGAAFIPLVSAGSLESAVPAIASGIGFAFHGPAAPKIQLLNYLRNKRMLLVLDNVEHLLAESPGQGNMADLIIEILQQAPQVKILVTSREALNVGEEWTFEIQGLEVPGVENVEPVGQFSAVALFVQRARRVRPGFEIGAENGAGITRLCRLVEGLPLAIELAAAWVRLLSVAEIVVEIERSLDFLNTGMRDVPVRHRSMRTVFDHSWQMLPAEEKQVLCRLSVFRGGFSRRAAEQVAGASLLVLSSLVIRSLVRRTATGRYDLHELVRQFAASKLAGDADELRRIRELHSAYYLALLEEKGSLLYGPRQKAALKDLAGEVHNLRDAWEWAVENHEAGSLYRASTVLWYLFELRGWFKEGEQIFERAAGALQAAPPVGPGAIEPEIARHALLAHSACFLFRQGKSEAAFAVLAPCVEFLRTAASQNSAGLHPLIYSLGYLGVVCWELGKFSEAVERLQEGLSLARGSGQRWYQALLNEDLGLVAYDQGEYAQARQHLGQALEIFRELGDPSFCAHTISYLGRTLQALGEYAEAEKLLRQSLEFSQEMEYRFGSGLALDALGRVAVARGNYPEAQELFSQSAGLFQDMGDAHRLARTLNHQGMAALALDQITAAENSFRAALALAKDGGLIPIALAAAAGQAAVQVRRECRQQTLALVLYLLRHPLANRATKDLAGSLQKDLEAVLSPQAVEAAHREAGSMDLDELLDQ